MKIFENLLNALKAHYDKLIAFVMLLCLIGSLLYLAVQIGRIQQMQKRWDEDLRRMKPKHPEAVVQDEAVYQRAQGSISEPFQIAHDAWTNRQLVVPEMRVWCTSCRWPVPITVTNCPFCRADLPDDKDVKRDSDRDGMWDNWERKYGLNPLDPEDAKKDKDGDGFTNKEEFDAAPQTDPSDAKSRPELIAKLRVDRIDVRSFMLKFKGTILGPDGFRNFQLNKRDLQRGGTKSFFAKIGATVEGCKIVRFEEKFEMKTSEGVRIAQKTDVSELTLCYGDNIITLKKDVEAEQFEFTAHLFFSVDQKSITGKVNDVFTIRDEQYKILRIDSDSGSVVIERKQDGKQFQVKKPQNP